MSTFKRGDAVIIKALRMYDDTPVMVVTGEGCVSQNGNPVHYEVMWFTKDLVLQSQLLAASLLDFEDYTQAKYAELPK